MALGSKQQHRLIVPLTPSDKLQSSTQFGANFAYF